MLLLPEIITHNLSSNSLRSLCTTFRGSSYHSHKCKLWRCMQIKLLLFDTRRASLALIDRSFESYDEFLYLNYKGEFRLLTIIFGLITPGSSGIFRIGTRRLWQGCKTQHCYHFRFYIFSCLVTDYLTLKKEEPLMQGF